MYGMPVRFYAIYELTSQARAVAIRNVIRVLNREWHLKLNMESKEDQASAEAFALHLCSAFCDDGSMVRIRVGE